MTDLSTFQFISILIGMFTSIITLVIYFHRSVAKNSKDIGIIEGALFKELNVKIKDNHVENRKKIEKVIGKK